MAIRAAADWAKSAAGGGGAGDIGAGGGDQNGDGGEQGEQLLAGHGVSLKCGVERGGRRIVQGRTLALYE